MQETAVRFLGREDPMGRAWEPTPVFFPRDSLWTEEAWWAAVHGVAKSRT